jgi:hypothetical protein
VIEVKMPPKAKKPWFQVWLEQNFGSLIVVALAVFGAIQFLNEFKGEIQNLAHTWKEANEYVFPLQSAIETSTISRVTTMQTDYVRRPFLDRGIC